MNSSYCFTAIEDQLLLALRDQGHYNWDFIEQISGRGEWALKHRYDMLHKGLRRMDPRGKGKMGVHTIRKLKMSKVPYGWTPKKDEDLQILHFKGHDWLEISYEIPPYNGRECLDRWLSLNPEAKYPFKTEMDFRWTLEDVRKLLSLKKAGRSWGETAKVMPWDETQCRKYWCSNHWYAFMYWFPDGRNFRDQPQFWQQKVQERPHKYKTQGQNIKNIAELNDEDAEEETDNEDVEEISEERYRKDIARGADNGGKGQKRKETATRREHKPASKKVKPSKQDAEREKEMLEADVASWMMELAEVRRREIRPDTSKTHL